MLKRKLLSVLLALVLVVSMAVPALALDNSKTVTGNFDNYGYSAYVYANNTKANGSFTYNNYNFQLKAYLSASIFFDVLGQTYYNTSTNYGFATVYSSVSNSKVIGGTTLIDDITFAQLNGYVYDGSIYVRVAYPSVP